MPAKKQPPSGPYDVGKTLPMPGKARSYVPAIDDVKQKPAAQEPAQPKRLTWKKALVSLLLLVIAAGLFIGTWDSINVSRAAQKSFGSGNLFSLMMPTALKGSDTGRVNVLIVGNSSDDPQNTGGKLTDSILVLSLSTTGHTSYMLSIPRDLYVNIPGSGGAKINAAYEYGGMGALEDIIGTDFKMPINYWVMVDNSAVRDIVNALGGVWVNVQSPDPRGLYDPNINVADGGPLKLTNGWHKLDGQTALNLSRARGDAPDSYGFPRADFNRTQHQRQIVTAIKDRISWTLVLNPLKNGRLFQAFGKNVQTDISLREVRPLFSLFNSVPSDKLQSVGLDSLGGKNYLVGTYYDGSTQSPAAGVDDFSQIDAALSQLNQ